MRIRYATLCAVAAVVAGGLGAGAQTASHPALPAPMTLHVSVTDKAGNPVTGLQASDFALLDNEHSTPIRGFAASANTPPLVVMVIDQVNEPFRALTIEQEQIENFTGQNSGHLPFPVSLIFLTDSGMQQVKPTTDGNALKAVLLKHKADLRAIDASNNDLYNGESRYEISLRAFESILDYEAGYPGRKLIVWISQGWPTLDLPEANLAVQEQKKIFGLDVMAFNLLRFTNTTIYSVDPEGNYDVGSSHSVEWQQYLKPVSRFDQAQYGDLAVQVLAERSGGLVRYGGNDTAQDISRCVEDATGGYDLTFQPQASENPNVWHSLRVKVDRRGTTVRALDGYFAQP